MPPAADPAERISVFVSWSGDIGKAAALALAGTVLDHPTLCVYVSPRTAAGASWRVEMQEHLTTAKHAIVCVTPSALSSSWVHYEAGALHARLKKLPLLLFGVTPEDLRGPLHGLQAVQNPADEAALSDLLQGMIGDQRSPAEVRRHVQDTVADFRSRLTAAGMTVRADGIARDGTLALEAAGAETAAAASKLAGRPGVRGNGSLQCVILHGLKQMADVAGDIAEEEDPTALRYAAPAGEYPEYLVALQESHSARVSAIALVNQEEHFWQGVAGRAILDTAHAGSRRVFVFNRADDFVAHYNTLLAHSDRYKIYAMDVRRLAASFERYSYDFSIIETMKDGVVSRVLAAYDFLNSPQHKTNLNTVQNNIVFSVNPRQIQLHEDTLARVIRYAVPIERDGAPLDDLVKNIFRTELTPLKKRTIEMSAYISIDDYDAHETRHAYYVEMMTKLISLIGEHPDAGKRPLQILELGAGTGIFTRRLGAAFPDAVITAVEIDWSCYKRLAWNTRDLPHVTHVNDDSRDFEPTKHTAFDVIVSSFADHHIHPADKQAYLRNIRHNLAPGGVFLVGDEFLPPYADGDDASYDDALRRYHGHIIDVAVAENEPVLEGLEREALKSGLSREGDFKISCNVFNHVLTAAGFDFSPTLIGPQPAARAAELGGVYVYRASPSA
jgi:SAM-dependent methyltransferase